MATIKLNVTTRESAATYAEALLDACAQAVDPAAVLGAQRAVYRDTNVAPLGLAVLDATHGRWRQVAP